MNGSFDTNIGQFTKMAIIFQTPSICFIPDKIPDVPEISSGMARRYLKIYLICQYFNINSQIMDSYYN